MQISQLGKLIVSLVAGVVSACALDAPQEPTATVSSELCNLFICGDNAAAGGDGMVFDEFDLFHKPNYAHVRMVSATAPGPGGSTVPIQLLINHDVLYGVDASGARYEGPALLNTIIEMRYQDASRLEDFQLKIEGIDMNTIHFLAGAKEVIPTYLIKARRPAKGMNGFDLFICNHEPVPIDPEWKDAPHNALVFRGDRYHPTQKRVLEISENNPWDPNNGWSFLACAGSGAAKLHLYRHTFAGGFLRATGAAAFMTSIPQRTVLLKTITDDVCGNGSTFTVAHNPLIFDVQPPFATPAPDLTIVPAAPPPPALGVHTYEAAWGLCGAVCLDEPRRERFGGLTRSQIVNACSSPTVGMCARTIPTCASMTPSLATEWRNFGYGVTANPW